MFVLATETVVVCIQGRVELVFKEKETQPIKLNLDIHAGNE